MKKIDNRPLWDAKRLIQEFFKMASLIKSIQGRPFDDIAWSNQIRVKRIASALRAFMGLKEMEENPVDFITSTFGGWDFDRLFDESPLQEEDHAKLMALLKEAMKDDHQYEDLTRMNDSFHEDSSRKEWEKYHERQYNFLIIAFFENMYKNIVSNVPDK